MSHWNYRVVKKRNKESNDVVYRIHEVYYSEAGAIEGWTKDPVQPLGETEFELREDIRYLLEAFRLPVLEEKEQKGQIVLVEESQDLRINQGHYFEFMDRTSVALDYLYQFLGCHPLMKKEKMLQDIYERAEKALVELYQEAGRLENERTEPNNKKNVHEEECSGKYL